MYKCECGKEFDNPQSFNGHKSNCKIHQEVLNKPFYQSITDPTVREKMSKTLKANTKAKKEKALEQWISEQHKCEKCGKIMTEKFGSGRFCSRACANSREHSEETKAKITEKVHEYVLKTYQESYCKICGKKIPNKNTSNLCKKCYLENYPEETKQKQSVKMQGKPRWNIHRNQTSFAENFWIEVLNNNDIKFNREVAIKFNEQHCYFLDFEILKNNKKIDLEIDGKQHKDRIESDIKRDEFLSKDYIIYRVEWNDIKSETGKLKMKQKIDDFIQFYNNL